MAFGETETQPQTQTPEVGSFLFIFIHISFGFKYWLEKMDQIKVVQAKKYDQNDVDKVSHFTPTICVSDSALKFTNVLYNLTPAGKTFSSVCSNTKSCVTVSRL